MYEGVSYCATSKFLTLGANGKTLKFCFFAIRVYCEKLGLMLKPLVPRFCPDLYDRLKDIAEKQVPTKLKPIVVYTAILTFYVCSRCLCMSCLIGAPILSLVHDERAEKNIFMETSIHWVWIWFLMMMMMMMMMWVYRCHYLFG